MKNKKIKTLILAGLLLLTIIPVSSFAKKDNDDKNEKKHRIRLNMLYKSVPFKFTGTQYTFNYSDPIDSYPITFDAISVNRMHQIGVAVGFSPVWFKVYKNIVELEILFAKSGDLRGGNLNLTLINGGILYDRFYLHGDFATGFGWARYKLSKIGIGNITGADFLLGPENEKVMSGTVVQNEIRNLTMHIGIGLTFYITKRLNVDLAFEYLFGEYNLGWGLITKDINTDDVYLSKESDATFPQFDVGIKGMSPVLTIGWSF